MEEAKNFCANLSKQDSGGTVRLPTVEQYLYLTGLETPDIRNANFVEAPQKADARFATVEALRRLKDQGEYFGQNDLQTHAANDGVTNRFGLYNVFGNALEYTDDGSVFGISHETEFAVTNARDKRNRIVHPSGTLLGDNTKKTVRPIIIPSR